MLSKILIFFPQFYNTTPLDEMPTPPSAMAKSLDILCSICGKVISNYNPEYFLEEEVNPACIRCKDQPSDIDDDDIPELHKENSDP